MLRRFCRNRVALVSLVVLVLMYLAMAFAEFVSPYSPTRGQDLYLTMPPQGVHILDDEWNLHWPFVYRQIARRDMRTLTFVYVRDGDIKDPVRLFVKGNPNLLVADEPTTALDVTVQAQILELIKGLQEEFQMALIMITHDLGVIRETADRVVVMYYGRVIETAPTDCIFRAPSHPYTRGLLRAVPRIGDRSALRAIPGTVPAPFAVRRGCDFHPRCEEVVARCRVELPGLTGVRAGHEVRCWMRQEPQAVAGG